MPTPPAEKLPEHTQSSSPPQNANAAAPQPARTCLFCGAVTFGVHCKVICPNCGYREDCSDLFRAE